MNTKLIATAKAPSRSTGTITLSWGLMNMSLSLYTGTEEVKSTRKEFVKGDPNRPAGRAIIDKTTEEIVDYADVERLTEASNGAWVSLTDDEMANAIGVKNVAEVLSFVPAAEALTAYVQDGYMQVRPKANKGKTDPASAKAFALFVDVLTERNLVALVRLATRGPARYALLNAEGDLIYVKSSDEVRERLAMQLPDVEADHKAVANQLVDAVGVGLPVLVNETAAKIQELADQKVGGGVAQATEAPTNVTAAVDLMATLMASIEEKKQSDPWGAPSGAPIKVAS
jgi:non-homologous end joining protein Ku